MRLLAVGDWLLAQENLCCTVLVSLENTVWYTEKVKTHQNETLTFDLTLENTGLSDPTGTGCLSVAHTMPSVIGYRPSASLHDTKKPETQ